MLKRLVLILITCIIIIIVTYSILLPIYLKYQVEDYLSNLSKRDNIEVAYESISWMPFLNKVTLKKLNFFARDEKKSLNIISSEVIISPSIFGRLFNKSVNRWVNVKFVTPVLTITPDRSSLFGGREEDYMNVTESDEVVSLNANSDEMTGYIEPPDKSINNNQVQILSSLQMLSQLKVETSENFDIGVDMFRIEIEDGEVHIKRGVRTDELASGITGYYDNGIEIKFHLLGGDEHSILVRDDRDDPIHLQETTTPADRLREVLFPRLNLNFHNSIATIKGKYMKSDDYQFQILLTEGVIQIGNKFSAEIEDVLIIMRSDNLILHHSDLLWNGTELKAEGELTDFNTGALNIFVTSDRIRMQNLINLVGFSGVLSPLLGEVFLFIGGTIDNPIYYIRYERDN